MQPNTNPEKGPKTDPAPVDPKSGAPKVAIVDAQPKIAGTFCLTR